MDDPTGSSRTSPADDLRARLLMTLDHEVEVLQHQFARNSVSVIAGEARFADPHTVKIRIEDGDPQTITADRFLLAVGTRPFRPAYVPFDGRKVLDTDEILDLHDVPRNITIIGAGVIGIEYATIFNALDIHVTVIEPRNEDPQLHRQGNH